MSSYLRACILAALIGVPCLGLAAKAEAATIVLDLSGFPNLVNGQVTGGDLTEAIAIPAEKKSVELKGLKPGMTYSVDLFHNSGEEGSDFTFTVNAADNGVESVTYASPKRAVLKGFKPGTGTLTLDTKQIVFDAEGKVGAPYYVPGLTPQLAADAGPQKLTAVPGIYNVDYLVNNAGGTEDWTFIVDEKGNVGPGPNSGEFAEFKGNEVKPRVTLVRFKIDASGPVNYHPTHKISGEAATVENVTTFDMFVPVGGGGVNVWTFGTNKVLESDAVGPDGKSIVGIEVVNDMIFTPRLRWDEKTGFYFDTPKGKAASVFSKVNGLTDGDLGNLTVTVTATILEPKAKAEEKK
jgi:hypothetical protein